MRITAVLITSDSLSRPFHGRLAADWERPRGLSARGQPETATRPYRGSIPHGGLFDDLMATTKTTLETPAQYHDRLSESCPMALQHWRALKSAFYSLLVAALMIYTVERGADPRVFVATVGAIVVIGAVELKEVQILDYISVTFRKTEREDDQ